MFKQCNIKKTQSRLSPTNESPTITAGDWWGAVQELYWQIRGKRGPQGAGVFAGAGGSTSRGQGEPPGGRGAMLNQCNCCGWDIMTIGRLYRAVSEESYSFKGLRPRRRIFTECLLSVIKRSQLYF